MKISRRVPILAVFATALIGPVLLFNLWAQEPKGNNAFIELCAEAGPEDISRALDRGARVNAVWVGSHQGEESRPVIYAGADALQTALQYNRHLASIKTLIEAGADVNSADGLPLVLAIMSNRVDYVDLLLRSGAEIGRAEDRGRWSLVLIAVSQDPDILRLVLEAGADPRAREDRGETALHLAVKTGKVEPVNILLAAGLDPNAVDDQGHTPLYEMTASPLIVETLARAGADVNLENNQGLTPFEVNDRPEVMDAFLAAGARLFKPGADGEMIPRGLAGDGTGYGRTRFFATADFDHSDTAEIGQVSALRLAVLSAVPLETESQTPVEAWPQMVSHRVDWVFDDTREPIDDFPYYIESERGALVYGRTGRDGQSARIYSPEVEEFLWEPKEMDYQARKKAVTILSSGRPHLLFDQQGREAGAIGQEIIRYGEKICFVHPEKREPVSGYPYYLVSADGYGLLGRTGKDGCTAELFTPGQDAFTVHGGRSAARRHPEPRL